jgi:hypothetical protein
VVLAIVPVPLMTSGATLVPIVVVKSADVATWKPAGGVTVIPSAMFAPETVKLVVDEAVP